MPDTLVIGLGGIGARVLRRLQDRVSSSDTESHVSLLVIDSDRVTHAPTGGQSVSLTATAAVIDAAYRTPERFHAEWIEPNVLHGRRTTEDGTDGSRMLGRFLFLLPDNLCAISEALDRAIFSLSEGGRIYVVAGAAGGTGGGAVADLGYLIRLLAEAQERSLETRCLLFVPSPADEGTPNAVATLRELHYQSDPNTLYRSYLAGEEEWVTRAAPFHRIHLITSLNADGEEISLAELQERSAVYLFTAVQGDTGAWAEERAQEEARVARLDPDGNPQVFATFGTEWVEYPEERIVRAVYRNLVRRSLIGWLHGDRPAQLAQLPPKVLMRDSAALAEQLTDAGRRVGAPEALIRSVHQRIPGAHKADQRGWNQMDRELETAVIEAIGVTPAPGRRAKGPIADRARTIRHQAIGELREQSAKWLSTEGISLDRVSRVLAELAIEIVTTTDPIQKWEGGRDATREARRRLLWAAGTVRKDGFLIFSKTAALKKLAHEYGRVATQYIIFALNSAAIPFMRDLRTRIQEPAKVWSERIASLGGLLSACSRAWADEESAYLERLRADDEAGRLALGLLTLPGKETPYVANSGWDLPFAPQEEQSAAISDLRQGWIKHLVEHESALLAGPGRSALDGDDRLRQAVLATDRSLRASQEDRLRQWLSGTVFQRLVEQYREPVELEFQLRRLVGQAAELPALEPPHARPGGFPSEFEFVFFEDAKSDELPSALRMVVDQADRQRPTRILPSRSPHYLTAITEHAGFSLARCPAFFQLSDEAGEAVLPFARKDVPWRSATLVTRERLQDASDVLYLALSFGILHGSPEGTIPLPTALIPSAAGDWRFPLPAEFDLAVRQLAGDEEALQGLALAVDRSVQAKGVEWCNLQVERAILGEGPSHVTFPVTVGRALLPAETQDQAQSRTSRLIAYRAAARYTDLADELARSTVGRETEWLRIGESHYCPSCDHNLGPDSFAIPGGCPACRGPLVPFKLAGAPTSDGFRRIPNPYVVGTPLETGASVFVGREDIIKQVRERLIRPAQRTILILIGERRSGKTSALKQLQYRLEGDLTPLFVDMQGLTASDLPGFLWWLAWRMKEALEDRGIQVDLPTYEEFTSGPPDYQFETIILPAIRKKLNGGRVLLMLDEFEVLAQRVMKGTFDGRAFDYLRHLMQHSEGIEFLFAGTHILRQFAANYVTFLFNIGVFLDVDFLQPTDALRLIQEPVAPSGIIFTPDSLDVILELAGAHPYFTQLFGFHLVERLNRLRKRSIGAEDVEAEAGPVIAAAGAHLDHVWGQLSETDKLLIAFFVQESERGQLVREDVLLQSAIRDDSTIRPYLFRTSVEKLTTVGLLREGSADDEEGRPVRTVGLTAEVYRRWLTEAHPYKRLREEGLKWGA